MIKVEVSFLTHIYKNEFSIQLLLQCTCLLNSEGSDCGKLITHDNSQYSVIRREVVDYFAGKTTLEPSLVPIIEVLD